MVRFLSDRIGVLHLGYLLEMGSSEEIFNEPLHPYTKSLLALGTLLSDGFSNALLHPYKLLPAAVIMILLMTGCHMTAEGVKKATGS